MPTFRHAMQRKRHFTSGIDLNWSDTYPFKRAVVARNGNLGFELLAFQFNLDAGFFRRRNLGGYFESSGFGDREFPVCPFCWVQPKPEVITVMAQFVAQLFTMGPGFAGG